MKRALIMLAVLLLVLCTSPTASADSARVQYPGNGHYYQRFDAAMTWSDARAYCESQGGYLATLTSAEEDSFVYQNVGQDGVAMWLGGTDETSEGTWEWITGEAWSYTNWASGQPNNISPGQDYLSYFDLAPGQWDDAGPPGGNETFSFICEWDELQTVPTLTEWGITIMFVLMAGSAIWMIRRRQVA